MQILEKRSTAVAAVLLTLVVVVTWSLNLESFSRSSILMYHIDVAVYLEGGLAFLRGENLYTQDFDFGSISLPFTYPPISAIVFSALAPFPLWVSSLVFIVATVVLLWWCCVIVLRHAVSGWGVGRTRIVALAILPFVVALEPVRETLGFAQVNVFLMAMVMVDVLTKKPWLPRGFWIGLAAAIKLTPAVFGLYFLVKRDFRAAAVTIMSGLGFTALAWAISPENSAQYWLHTVRDPSRIGGLSYGGNQSFKGFLARVMAEPGQDAVWRVLVVATIVAAALAMYRTTSPAMAISLNSLVALLCSPVSWTHHWVWLIPLTLLTIVQAVHAFQRQDWVTVSWAASLSLASLAAMLVEPHWVLPHKNDTEALMPLSGLIIGSSYVWIAVAFLVMALRRSSRLSLRWTSATIIVATVLVFAYTFSETLRIRHFLVFEALRSTSLDGVFTHPLNATPLVIFLGRPLASLRLDFASTMLVMANMVALYVVVVALLRHLRLPIDGPLPLAATAVAVISHPVRDTLMGGHWTLMFLALIVADVFLPTVRWPRGLLSGIAVALGGGWPLLSAVAAFSALKNYRAIGIVLGSCAASFGLGFVVARETTLSYFHTLWHWPETIFAALTGSINNTAYAMVARALGGSSTLSWLIMVVVVLAVAHFAAQRAGDRYVAAAFGLCLPALVLPYSTATVWVLLLPLVVLLARWNPIAAAFGAYLLWFEWFPARLDYIYGGIRGEWWLPPFEVFASAPALYLLVLMLLSLGGKIAQPSTGTLAKK